MYLHFTCNKKTLHEALQSVSHAVATRSTLPILSHVLLDVRDGALHLITTDLEISMSYVLPLEGPSEEGAVTVPHRILADVVSRLPDEMELAVTADERNRITLTSGTSNYTIHGLPSAEFPALPQVPGKPTISFKDGTLRDLVRKTLFAASADANRMILTGCLLAWDKQMATMVATDTHRLAVKRVPASAEWDQPVSVIIPSRTLHELLRLLGEKETVEMSIGNGQVLFTLDRVRYISRLIEGQFPAHDRVIPQHSDRKVVANRAKFYEAVVRAGIVAQAESNKIVLRVAEDKLEIDARSGEVGEAHEQIAASLEGEGVEIAFNAGYIEDVLGVLTTETVELGLTGPLNPGLLRADGEGDYQYVVMPMQML